MLQNIVNLISEFNLGYNIYIYINRHYIFIISNKKENMYLFEEISDLKTKH